LEDDVWTSTKEGVELPDIVFDVCISPKFQCRKFHSIWAFGSHFRVASYEKRLEMQDSGVAANFTRPWRANARDQHVVEENVEYIGELEEIVELDYRHTCVVVFVCRWVKANYCGPNVNVKRDKWGFTLANFQSCQQFGKESFVFPKHCEQVFFNNARKTLGWRVVLRQEVRGRRVDNVSNQI